jgi:hypothetical protein
MEQGDGPVEFRLGLVRAGDGELDLAQGVAGVFLGLAPRLAREATE